MKKSLIFFVATLLSVTSIAQDNFQSQKLQLVKNIYKVYKNDGEDRSAFFNNITPDFQSVFDEDDRTRPEGEMGCIEYDMVIQGQNFNPKEITRTLKISMTPKGNVLATFKNFGRSNKVTYIMKCDNGRCLIDDVLENGESYKQGLRECVEQARIYNSNNKQ